MMQLQTNKGQTLPANHQMLGERHGIDSLSQLSIGSNPADTLISDFGKTSELGDNKFLLL